MSRLLVHTIDQPESDVTAFILSCNRLHLLERTVKSFLATRDLVTKIVIVDDSGLPEVFEKLVAAYGDIADVVCFPENRGLWWAKDFMASFCSTPYIFYVEDDWLFLNSGYLTKSKAILEKHREIGSIDISWRTFEEEAIDAYAPELVDGEFYYKKPFQISERHLFWFCWHGSPNLKRRDDLLLLGRVEKYYNEWNVDRKFFALGFRGVFLKDRYVVHLGDHESLMVNKRPHEGTTPETLFPDKLLANRTFPSFDYYQMDRIASAKRETPIYRDNDICFATCLVDIGREQYDGRNFEQHYLKGLKTLLEIDKPLVVFTDDRYYEKVMAMTGGSHTNVIIVSRDIVKHLPYYPSLQAICQSELWQNQADWMKTSIVRSPDYIGLTLHKLELLMHCVRHHIFKAKRYYWIDAGICNSFSLPYSLKECDFSKLPISPGVFMTCFPYNVVTEMHGYSKQGFELLCGKVPSAVCRATLFGGTMDSIPLFQEVYNDLLRKSLAAGYIGTEEALFSGIAATRPDLCLCWPMESGDIKNYLQTLRV